MTQPARGSSPGGLAVPANPTWSALYKIGGAAALVAGLVFRRNLGAEVSLFSPQKQPHMVGDWFTLLQQDRLLGLAYLSFFDVIDYALLGLMLLALYVALRRVSESLMGIALTLGLVGIGVYLASNPAFELLSLSEQYAVAGDAQRATLLAAGQALLAAYQGTGMYLSFLFLALAGLLTSLVMLQGSLFGRATAYVGILACLLDLAYCLTFAWVPALTAYLLSAAGLLLMIWHLLIGLRLLRLGRPNFNATGG